MVKKKVPEANHILIEYFDAKFNLLIDGYTALDKKIDDLRAEMNRRFGEVDERLKAIEEHLELHDNQFEVMFEELHSIRGEVTAHGV
jgi:23S rRNA C2498 (ribose-2'-O)-methylase RlmM